MQPIIPPPIKTAISEFKTGIVSIIWNQFFLSIFNLFSQPSYGGKNCSFTISGISGAYTTSYKWISDRNFVHFYITIIPTSTVVLSSATLLPVFQNPTTFNDNPIHLSNVLVSLYSGTTLKDSRQAIIDTTGSIKLPDIASTSYSIQINGSFIKEF